MCIKVFLFVLLVIFMCTSAFAMCGVCGVDSESKGEDKMNMFLHVAGEAAIKNGVKEITYEQFMKIKNSGEDYKLLDVLSSESYNEAHIEGAVSFPLDTINKETAEKMLSKSDHIIAYCGSFECSASTKAAEKLSKFGYNVLDYKGGLKEWQERNK